MPAISGALVSEDTLILAMKPHFLRFIIFIYCRAWLYFDYCQLGDADFGRLLCHLSQPGHHARFQVLSLMTRGLMQLIPRCLHSPVPREHINNKIINDDVVTSF